MVDFDKKFLFKKIKLAVVGKINDDTISSFKYLGFQSIERFSNQKQALEKMQSHFYGMIVCFENLDISCFSLIKALRGSSGSSCRFSPILLIATQAMITKQFVASARDSGSTEIVTIPTSTIALREKISLMLESPRNFIISRNYIGPDRRRKKVLVEAERRKDS